MSSVIKLEANEQIFTSANLFFSTANSTTQGWVIVRVVNISNSASAVATVEYPVGTMTGANVAMTILPLQEVFIKKPANTPLLASSANLMGTLVAFENN